ncbi:hypothetical protein BG006_000438 [Podila minutissima]|uniref:Uncharacterized protein n=1 Tax=Podila minutissima TaxID=64525 RepID=A0A9P5VHM5_9FUNG|nr:hypothetical protein BG006_000438 [Podila minutissima]
MALDRLETCSDLVKFVATTIAVDEPLKQAGKDDKTKPWLCCKQLRYFEVRFSGMIPIDPTAPDAKKAGKV